MAGDHWFETRVIIAGTTFEEPAIIEMSATGSVFPGDQPSVGACISGELSLTILRPSAAIPRMAAIQPQVRACNASQQTAWLPQGTYFIDTREELRADGDVPALRIHAFDAMLKTEAMFPDTEAEWPQTDFAVVEMIAAAIGVGIDDRTDELMSHAYEISLPAGYTMRETLSYIGAMYAGNWILTYGNELLLVPINSVPDYESVLADHDGLIITFGEVEISLVDTTV